MSFKFQIPNPPLDRPFVARVVTSRYGINAPGTIVNEVPVTGVRFAEALDEDYAQYRTLGAWQNAAVATELIELAQTVPAGTTEVNVDNYVQPDEWGAEKVPSFAHRIERALRIPNKIRLRWENTNSGASETLSLTGRSAIGSPRSGRYVRTNAFHENTLNFGSVHFWFTLSEYDPRLFLTINWHNGIPRSDILFNSLQLLLPAGWKWKPVIAEDRAYDIAGNYLARPTDPVTGVLVNHMLGKRCERPFRVVIYLEDQGEPAVTYDDGLGYRNTDSDAGDPPYFGPSAVRFPSLAYMAGLAANVEASYQAQKGYLFNLTNDPELSARTPQNYLFPTLGDTYGGVSGGLGIDWHNGCRWLGSKAPNGLMLHYIQQLRWRSRPSGAMYCDVVNGVVTRPGEPCTPEANLTAGFAPWYLGVFRRFVGGNPVKDQPWNWRTYPRPAGPFSYQNSIDTDGFNGGWDPVDDQHYIRAMRDNIALAYIAADDLAILYLTVDAELARMIAWNKPGAGRALFDVGTPNLGVGWGRGQGWSLWLVAAAGLFSTGTARGTRLKAWASYVCRQRSRAKMPSGLMLASNASAKAQTAPPFGDNTTADYYVAQNFEEIIMTSGMWATSRVFGEFTYEGGVTLMSQLIGGVVNGMRDLAWHTDADGVSITGTSHKGPWKRYPLDVNPSAGPRYTNRLDFVPQNICVVDPEGDPGYDNTLDSFYIGQVIGMLGGSSIDMICFNRMMGLNGQSLATCQAALQAVGVQFSGGGSKIETFLPLLQTDPS